MRSDKPTLSVILPVFNCEKYVGRAIESILAQSFSDFELLIADDGSTDSSRDIISRAANDSRITCSHNAVNCGKVGTVNRLFALAKGQFVTVHDADDISHKDRFARQIAFFQKDHSVIMCGTSFRMVTETGKLFRDVVMPANPAEIRLGIRKSSQFHGPTMMIRRSALADYLYRPFFNGFNEDCDLAFRLLEQGFCTNLKEILYTYRILPGSLSKGINAEKKNWYKMALVFHDQRAAKGTDDLMEGKVEKVREKLNSLMVPYNQDPSRIYRENAASFMYYRFHKAAIANAWRGCIANPYYFANWRTLQYCLRKTVLGI